MAGLVGELQELIRYTKALRDYDRDRLGYIERRRLIDGKNFHLDPYEVVITDGGTARKVLAGTNKTNQVNVQLYATKDPLSYATQYTARWMPARQVVSSHMRRAQVAEHANRVLQSTDSYLRSIETALVDVTDTFKLASGIAMCDLVFGSDGSSLPQMLENSVQANLPIMDSSRLSASWALTPRVRRQRSRSQELSKAIEAIVRERICAAPRLGHDILSKLVADKGAVDEIRDALKVTLLASFGVPGATVAWTLAALVPRQATLGR